MNLIRERAIQLQLPGVDAKTELFDPVTVTFKGGKKEPFASMVSLLRGIFHSICGIHLRKVHSKCTNHSRSICWNRHHCLHCIATQQNCLFLRNKSRLAVYEFNKNTGQTLKVVSTIGIGSITHSSGRERRSAFPTGKIPTKIIYYTKPMCKPLAIAYFLMHLFMTKFWRVKSWIDEVALENPMLADLITVATLSALVPCIPNETSR